MYRCQSCGALNNVNPSGQGTPVCGRCKQALDTSGAPQAVDGAALVRAINAAQVPVLVDFWAPWCGPCKAAAPIVEQFAREHAGRLIALKLDTDENPVAANSYGIQGIPTFIVFRGGAPIGRKSGAMPKPVLDAWVSEVTGSGAGAQYPT